VLAKEYRSLAALEKDNFIVSKNPLEQSILYFDSALDKTPYELLDRYKIQKEEMLPPTFFEFLCEALIQRHGCPASESRHLAKVILDGKRDVEDGHYAVLRLPSLSSVDTSLSKLPDTLLFYRRLRHHWIRDDDVKKIHFMPAQELFYQLHDKEKEKEKEKEKQNKSDLALVRIRQNEKETLLSEFQRRYEISMEEQKAALALSIQRAESFLDRKRAFLKQQDLKRSILLEIQESPFSDSSKPWHWPFRCQGGDDKEAQRILHRLHTHGRIGVESWNESPDWIYNHQTNELMCPRSCALLYADKEGYKETLVQLVQTQGVRELDWMVDEKSGVFFCPMDVFCNPNEKEKEKEKETPLLLTPPPPDKELESLLRAMVQQLRFGQYRSYRKQKSAIETTVLRITGQVCSRVMRFDETEYEALRQEKQRLPTYANYRHETHLVLMGLLLLFVCQVRIEDWPEEWRGFPAEPDPLSPIDKLATMLLRLKHTHQPWSSLRRYTHETLRTRILTVWRDGINGHDEVLHLFNQFHHRQNKPQQNKEYVQTKQKYEFSGIANAKAFMETLESGDTAQHKMQGVFDSQIAKLTFSLLEEVKLREYTFAKTVWQQTNDQHPIVDQMKQLSFVVEHTRIVDRYDQLPHLFNANPASPQRPIVELPTQWSPLLLTRIYIFYAGIDRGLSIPLALKRFYPDNLFDASYNPSWTIEEKHNYFEVTKGFTVRREDVFEMMRITKNQDQNENEKQNQDQKQKQKQENQPDFENMDVNTIVGQRLLTLWWESIQGGDNESPFLAYLQSSNRRMKEAILEQFTLYGSLFAEQRKVVEDVFQTLEHPASKEWVHEKSVWEWIVYLYKQCFVVRPALYQGSDERLVSIFDDEMHREDIRIVSQMLASAPWHIPSKPIKTGILVHLFLSTFVSYLDLAQTPQYADRPVLNKQKENYEITFALEDETSKYVRSLLGFFGEAIVDLQQDAIALYLKKFGS
jgi:hypothetical protein